MHSRNLTARNASLAEYKSGCCVARGRLNRACDFTSKHEISPLISVCMYSDDAGIHPALTSWNDIPRRALVHPRSDYKLFNQVVGMKLAAVPEKRKVKERERQSETEEEEKRKYSPHYKCGDTHCKVYGGN